MSKPTPPHQAILDAATTAHTRIRSTAVPVFGHLEDRVDLCGSGSLLRAGSTHLLVTAAHVLDAAKDRPVVPLDGALDRPLRGVVVKTTAPATGRYHDLFDFGAVLLDRDEVAALSGFAFIGEPDLLHETSRSRGLVGYTIAGFPATTLRRDRVDKLLGAHVKYWLGPELPDADYRRSKLDPKSHLLVSRDAKRARGPRGAGKPFQLPGMSGAGVWRIGANLQGELVQPPHYVGMFIERSPHNGHALVCVRTGVLMTGLGAYFPEVQQRLPSALRGEPESILGSIPTRFDVLS